MGAVRRFVTRLGVLATGLVMAVVLLPTGPASAATSWGGYDNNYFCLPDYTGCVYVQVEGRVGTAHRYDDSTAGWGRVEAQRDYDGVLRIARVQIDKVVLGTQYGVLTTSAPQNSGTTYPPFAQLQGPGHLWGRFCTTRYHVAVYWSARMTDGSLRTGKLLGPWYDSANCY